MIIYLSRHGESEYNLEKKLGGDSNLSENGKLYSKKLEEYITNNTNIIQKKCITSTKKRTIQTSNYLKNHMIIENLECLDEINAGIAENMTYNEFKNTYPDEYEKRKLNKLIYKYPDGESYIDLMLRTKQFCDKTIENKENILIISHQAITRALLYHFCKIDILKVPELEIPLHKILVITDGKYEIITP